MTTTTSVIEFKRSMIRQIRSLLIQSDVASAAPRVQVGYSAPPVDQRRSESVWWSDQTNTIADPDHRLQAGRRTRIHTWEIDLVVHSQVKADPEDAEMRAFEIAAEIENFIAANPHPGKWINTLVDDGTLTALVVGFRSELTDTAEGPTAVEVVLTIEMKERLT